MKIIKEPSFVVKDDWWVGLIFTCYKCGMKWSLDPKDPVEFRAGGSWREASSDCPNCGNTTSIANGGTP